MNENLPHYVVMHAKTNFAEQSLFNRLWGTGFLPSDHQGMLMRSQGDPVLYLSNPAGVTREDRRAQLDALAASTSSSTNGSPTRKSWRASGSTKWPTACRPRCPN